MSKERFDIEEAILHAKEIVEKNRRAYKNCPAELNTKGYTCERCADEYEQLAKWLEELKQYRDLKEQGSLQHIECHCKDCVHWSDMAAGATEHVKVCTVGRYMVGENGYCVYAKRKV